MSDDDQPAERKRVPTTDSQYERTKNERDQEPQATPRKHHRSGS